MRSLRSVLGAVGIRPKQKEPAGWYWLDTYPVEDFWGSPCFAYYIQDQELGLDAWYVVELRVMREKLPKKDPPKTCREYIVATVAKTETRDPTGNGYLIFERVKQRRPTLGWDVRGAHPDRTREREIFQERKAVSGRPWDMDFSKYLNFTFNARLRYMHVDRVRISARPWLYETDEVVAILRLSPPELDATPTATTPRQSMPSTTQTKCRWLFVWELVYIATRLNRSRELFHIFPDTVHWLPGMMIHVVRNWTGSALELRHRDGKRSVQIGSDEDMPEWYERQQSVMQRQHKQKDKDKEDYSDVIRVIKTPRNITLHVLVEEYWHYCTHEDILGMFEQIELKDIEMQGEVNRQFREELDKMRKKTQERVDRIYAQKDKEIFKKQQEIRAQKRALAEGRQRKIRVEEKSAEGRKSGEESRVQTSRGESSGQRTSSLGESSGQRPSSRGESSGQVSAPRAESSAQRHPSRGESKGKERSLLRYSLEGPKSRFGSGRGK